MPSNDDKKQFSRNELKKLIAQGYTVILDGDNLSHSINAMIADTVNGPVELKKPASYS
jgi:hypothetical protein